MKRLTELHDHLAAARFCRPEQLHAVAEEGAPQGSFKATGNGVLVLRHAYTGRIELKKGAGDLAHVLALVAVWFEENAGQDDEFMGWAGEPSDDRSADIDLRFRFDEEIHYVLAEPGYSGADKITWRGEDYKRAAETADVADTLDSIVPSIEP